MARDLFLEAQADFAFAADVATKHPEIAQRYLMRRAFDLGDDCGWRWTDADVDYAEWQAEVLRRLFHNGLGPRRFEANTKEVAS